MKAWQVGKVWQVGKRWSLIMGCAGLLGLVPAMGFETIPTSINYQGKLARQNGDLVDAPAGLQMTFHIYDDSHGGTLMWTEVHPAVVVDKGQFSVDLGSITPFNLAFDQPYYLGITVFPDTSDAVPRRPLTSVGYALNSVHAQNSDHATRSSDADSADALSPGTKNVNTGNAAAKGLVVKAANGQSANLQEWQDSSGAPVASVSASGMLNGNGGGLTNVHAQNSDHALRSADADSADALSPGTKQVNTGNPAAKGLVVKAASGQSENLQEWQDSAGAPVASVSASGMLNGNGGGLTNVRADDLSPGTKNVNTGNPAAKGLVVKAAASQSANLQEWQDSAGAPVASVSATGVFNGNGSGLTSLNASNLSTGTLPSAQLSGTYSSSVTFSSPMNSFSGIGAGLLNLNATNLLTGTVPGGRLSGTYSNAVTFSSGMNSFTGDGSGLTNLNVNTANFTRKVNEQRVAVVATGLQSGIPVAASAYYLSPAAALSDLLTWCPSPTQSAPCVIKVMPGSYTLSSQLQMVQGVDIVGSGESSTRFVCNVSAVPSVVGASNSSLSFVTLEAPSSPSAPAASLAAGTFRHMSVVATAFRSTTLVTLTEGASLEDVAVASLGSGSGGGWAIEVTAGSPTLTNVRVSATGAAGIKISGQSSPTLTNVTLTMPAGVAVVSGIRIEDNSTPILNTVAITASGSATLKGISIDSSSPKMTDVVIRLSSGDGSIGIENLNSSTVAIDNSVIELTPVSCNSSRGVTVNSSTLEMRGVLVKISNCGGAAPALETIGPGTVAKIDHCVISATTALLRTNGTLQVGATKLDASTTASGAGGFSCVYTYNGNYLPLNSSCL